MNKLFLGRPIHWLVAAILAGLGWAGGHYKLHVISFNLFIVLTIVAVVVAILAVLKTTPPGESPTRDPIVDE